ncbi:MAG: hypothetical protein ACR2G6_09660 [Gemmatimonadaceae bacterium]
MGDAPIEDLAAEMYAGAGSLDKSPKRLSDEEMEQFKERKLEPGEYAM